jgi:hypothetical protein
MKDILAQAEQIVAAAIAQKPTKQDYEMQKALSKLVVKVLDRIQALKKTGKP